MDAFGKMRQALAKCSRIITEKCIMGSMTRVTLLLACTAFTVAGCASGPRFYRGVDLSNKPAPSPHAQPNPEYTKLRAEIARLEAPDYAAAAQAKKEASQVGNDPDGLIKNMVDFTDLDRGLVDVDRFPSDVLSYDARMIKLLVASPATAAEHHQDSSWTKKFNALQSARALAIKRNAPAVERMDAQQRQFNQNQTTMAELMRQESDDKRRADANRAADNAAYQQRLGNDGGQGACQIPTFGGTGTEMAPCPDGN